jgi:phage baseplate assembly protein W
MAGIDAVSGVVLDELADIRQSISDIITTPVGTRVMRRDYGSHIFDLIDAPGTDLGAIRMIAAAADAIARWELRVRMKSARLSTAQDGRAILSTACVVRASGLTITSDSRLAGFA